MTPRQILAQMNRECKQRFKDAAKTIPSEVVVVIRERAKEGVSGSEPHKATGGYIIIGFEKSHDLMGLLEVAATELKAAMKQFQIDHPYQF